MIHFSQAGQGWTDVEQSDQKCWANMPDQDSDNDEHLIDRNFVIGGCFVITEFTNLLDTILIEKPLSLDNILYYNPCFTYTQQAELMAFNYVDGTAMQNVPGSRFGDGYFNMNCQFGSSLTVLKGDKNSTKSDEKYDRIFVGAAGQHQQGNIFKINRRRLNKHEFSASGLDKIKSLTKDGLLEFSTPDYDSVKEIDEEVSRNFQQSDQADSRSGSELNVIRLGKTQFIVDSAFNKVNKNHKKSGCVSLMVRETQSLTFDGKKIASLKTSSSGFSSGESEVCGTLSHESFGYSTLVVDVNGDGLDDLIIGSPRYSEMPKDGSKPKLDIGRIVILLQTNDHKLDDENLIQIKGIDMLGQFGFKIESAGDLNNDGIIDLMVGAPYAGWDRRYPDKETGKVRVCFQYSIDL